MKNFINVRVQSYNYKKQYDLLRHNFRHKKDSLSQINEKPNFFIGPNGKLLEIDNTNKKKIYDIVSKEYQKDRTKHNEIYKAKHKRNLRDFQATWTDGVLTFSEAIHEDLGNKYTQEDLIKVATSCANDIAKKYGTQLIYLTLHMDETTPHFHFSLKNYDENGLSLWKKNQNKEFLSQLQDIAFEHFKKLGMQRGISKEFTGKRYETIQKYHVRKEMELRDKVLNTQANYDKLQKEVEKDLKSLYAEVNLKKNEVKDLRSNYDRTSQEYKDLTIVFKQLQVEEKTLRDKVREFKDLDLKLTGIIELEKDISRQLEEKTKELNEAKAERMRIYEGTRTLDETHKALLDEIGNNQKGLKKEIEALRNQRKDIRYILSLESDIEQFKAFIDFKNLNQEFEDFKQENSDTKKIDR